MKPITKCRACKKSNLQQFLDLGNQYLSDFREDESKTNLYPLQVVMCENCQLVQLKHTTPQPEMYHERYGFKSGISDSIKKDLDDVVVHAFQYQNSPKNWLDIASNDGTLLSFIPEDVHRVGVDPVGFLCEEAKQHADEIINDYFSKEVVPDSEYDVVTSVSCFYDMPDPEKFVGDVASILAPRGVWVIQQNYLLSTLQLDAVDNFCHEHLEYYTLLSLEKLLDRFDLEVNEVRVSMVNGGSIRTVVSKKGTYPIDDSVLHQRLIEFQGGVGSIETYRNFANRVMLEVNRLRTLVVGLRSENKTIAILAASTRGATIWQSAGLDSDLIEYAVERNPAKVGKIFSAVGIPIVSEEFARKAKPDYMIIGPWFFADEIIKREEEYLRAGGKLILPLPKVTVIDSTSLDA